MLEPSVGVIRNSPYLVGLAFVAGINLVVGAPFAALLAAAATSSVLLVLNLRCGVWPWLSALAVVPAAISPALALDSAHLTRDVAMSFVVAAAILTLAWRVWQVLVWGSAALVVGIVTVAAVVTHTGGSVLGPFALVISILGALLATAAVAGAGRAGGSGLRVLCAALVLLPAAAYVGTVVRGEIGQWHEVLALCLWPVAGAFGFSALARGRRGRATQRPQIDEHDMAASQLFGEQYGEVMLAPVTVVIAAYNEAPSLGAVLDELPATVAGHDLDVLVIDDGSSDATAQTIREHPRPMLVAPGVNRGQGSALRLGYRIAREHGARYIITTDADGQYDPADFERVLAPILDGSADFVSGSRTLGEQETRDRVRRLGVHVFAWMVSGLTGQWLTDTSFGLRAMRSEVTEVVTLNQVQYQSSELLIGVLSHGFRVQEVPGRMRVRDAGASKKGGNAVYGSRYARVVLGTWWREGCPSPITESPRALAPRSRAPSSVLTTNGP